MLGIIIFLIIFTIITYFVYDHKKSSEIEKVKNLDGNNEPIYYVKYV